ncbi:MAG: RNA ligase family protein [Deltaproteobacteria bacterium]|nr:RNA ligase family protein [Deltaproteobacteria bacterium]
MHEAIHKYPRTHHLEGSRLQPGDHDLAQVPLASLRGRYCVVEEKLDGANAGLSLDERGRLRLQSRGHVLSGGPRERHWDLFKQWARAHETALAERLAAHPGGLTIYGEWLYAKHTVFYDQLPHYFMEFDIRDAAGAFWSTARRAEHLAAAPIVAVPVVWEGVVEDPRDLPELVAPSLYKSARWREALRDAAVEGGVEPERCARETDASDHAEGLYVKVEDRATGTVVGRYKWIRPSFHQAIQEAGDHWLQRPIVANRLAEGVDLFASPGSEGSEGSEAP